eukprot:1156892-Pelagomonas_calceolata.AAC.2
MKERGATEQGNRLLSNKPQIVWGIAHAAVDTPNAEKFSTKRNVISLCRAMMLMKVIIWPPPCNKALLEVIMFTALQ